MPHRSIPATAAVTMAEHRFLWRTGLRECRVEGDERRRTWRMGIMGEYSRQVTRWAGVLAEPNTSDRGRSRYMHIDRTHPDPGVIYPSLSQHAAALQVEPWDLRGL